ncbi:MAG: hypothetical protein AAB268_05990 [Elusimicrobiota bacterium]
MTRMILTAMVLLPAAASACESTAAASGACASGHGCGPVAIALMAAVAALGVWILRSVEKDGAAVKRTGQVVGWTLAVVGMSGFLCGAISHALKSRSRSCHVASDSSEASERTLPPGHPPLGPSVK